MVVLAGLTDRAVPRAFSIPLDIVLMHGEVDKDRLVRWPRPCSTAATSPPCLPRTLPYHLFSIAFIIIRT